MIGLGQLNGIMIGAAIARSYFGLPPQSILVGTFISSYLAVIINLLAAVHLSKEEG